MDALEAEGHFFLAGNLASLGMHTSIWTTARKLDAEDNLYRFAGLASHEWFDDRLLRICKVRSFWLLRTWFVGCLFLHRFCGELVEFGAHLSHTPPYTLMR